MMSAWSANGGNAVCRRLSVSGGAIMAPMRTLSAAIRVMGHLPLRSILGFTTLIFNLAVYHNYIINFI